MVIRQPAHPGPASRVDGLHILTSVGSEITDRKPVVVYYYRLVGAITESLQLSVRSGKENIASAAGGSAIAKEVVLHWGRLDSILMCRMRGK